MEICYQAMEKNDFLLWMRGILSWKLSSWSLFV